MEVTAGFWLLGFLEVDFLCGMGLAFRMVVDSLFRDVLDWILAVGSIEITVHASY